MNPNRYRCPVCGTRRTDWNLLAAHQRQHGHTPCTCGGYHHPHRPGSPYCDGNPTAGVLRAMRDGWEPDDGTLRDAIEEVAFTQPGRPMKAWPYD